MWFRSDIWKALWVALRRAPRPDALLWQATIRAYHRMRTLALLVDVTGGEKPASELRPMIAEFFAIPHSDPEMGATNLPDAHDHELEAKS
jgi:hypothetical protein